MAFEVEVPLTSGDAVLLEFKDGADRLWTAGAFVGPALLSGSDETIKLSETGAMGFKVHGFKVVRG